MRIRFDEQLELLNRKLIEMGALCEDAISASMHTLKNETDKQSAEKAAALEREIDHKEREIESLCMKLLLQQQPVARDLRTISSALKMISDLERIGDQASDIAGITGYIEDEQLKSGTHIYEMARAVAQSVGHLGALGVIAHLRGVGLVVIADGAVGADPGDADR